MIHSVPANDPVPARQVRDSASGHRMSPLVPAAFSVTVGGRGPEPDVSGDAWLARLPQIMDESLAQWEVTLDGEAMFGSCALVLPVRRRDSPGLVDRPRG